MEGWKISNLSTNTSVCGTSALKVNDATSFEIKSALRIFKNYYSTLADNLLQKLPTPHNKYNFNSVIQYYRHFVRTDSFRLTYTTKINIEKILKSTNVQKAGGIDDLPDSFLKDGLQILSKPISELCNLSIKLGNFPDSYKIAKLKRLFKKGSRTDPSNYKPISILPLIFKVIEKIFHEQTSSFLFNNEILHKYQSGFRTD